MNFGYFGQAQGKFFDTRAVWGLPFDALNGIVGEFIGDRWEENQLQWQNDKLMYVLSSDEVKRVANTLFMTCDEQQ